MAGCHAVLLKVERPRLSRTAEAGVLRSSYTRNSSSATTTDKLIETVLLYIISMTS